MSNDFYIQRAKQSLPLKSFLDQVAPDWRKNNPLRADDKTNSFSCNEGGWVDHGTEEKGDQIAFLMKRDGMRFKEAKEQFLAMAGVTISRDGGGLVQRSEPKVEPIPNEKPVNWQSCVDAFTDDRAKDLAEWRGYPMEFVAWLKKQKLIGIHAGQFALPIHDETGQVVGIHHKHPDGKWRTISKTAPLVIGDRSSKKWLIFESQWDAFAVMEALCHHLEDYEPPHTVLITRGADNGKFTELIPEDAEAIVIMQNDQPKKGVIPAEKWLATIQEKCMATLRIARPPAEVKDCNDWLKRGDADFNRMICKTEPGHPLDRLLEARAFSLENPPAKPVPVLLINGKPIATAGNIVAITGPAKSGKTALESAMLASLMSPTGDTLGVTGCNGEGLPVLHFDTEQSQYDHHAIILQALQRSGREKPPDWLKSYCLTDVDTQERRKLISHAMARFAVNGRIRAVFLDGVGDVCLDVNDSAEAIGLVAELHRLAITYDCPIICILHENPGENTTGKTRGHLGSQLERKAETNLRIAKDGEVSVAFTERSRHCHIPKESGPRFQWDDTAGMHVSCLSSRDEKAEEEDFHLRALTDEIFHAKAVYRYSELMTEIKRIKGVKDTQAENIQKKLMSRYIKKTALGYEKG